MSGLDTSVLSERHTDMSLLGEIEDSIRFQPARASSPIPIEDHDFSVQSPSVPDYSLLSTLLEKEVTCNENLISTLQQSLHTSVVQSCVTQPSSVHPTAAEWCGFS